MADGKKSSKPEMFFTITKDQAGIVWVETSLDQANDAMMLYLLKMAETIVIEAACERMNDRIQAAGIPEPEPKTPKPKATPKKSIGPFRNRIVGMLDSNPE
jgi:hypothetical protein